MNERPYSGLVLHEMSLASFFSVAGVLHVLYTWDTENYGTTSYLHVYQHRSLSAGLVTVQDPPRVRWSETSSSRRGLPRSRHTWSPFGYARWVEGKVKYYSELEMDQRTWGATILDVVKCISGACSTSPPRVNATTSKLVRKLRLVINFKSMCSYNDLVIPGKGNILQTASSDAKVVTYILKVQKNYLRWCLDDIGKPIQD